MAKHRLRDRKFRHDAAYRRAKKEQYAGRAVYKLEEIDAKFHLFKSGGRVLKGKRMAGQMGNERVTVQNLKIVKVMKDEGLLLVSGAIPGGKNGLVTVRHSVKSAARARGKK